MILQMIVGKIERAGADDKTKQIVLEFIQIMEEYLDIPVKLSAGWEKLKKEGDDWIARERAKVSEPKE